MPTILVIDDEPLMRRTLRTALEQAGHTVVESVDGNDGLTKFETCQPDLVLTDIIMPDREGVETIREIRRLRPDIPIIAMSGGGRIAGSIFLDLAQNLGATATLGKPIRNADLLRTVNDCLNDASAVR